MNKTVLIFMSVFLFVFISCKQKKQEVIEPNDFELINKKGELTIITLNSSTSYFIYREDSLGYDYDLAKDFCAENNLKLNVKVAKNVNHLIAMLMSGEGDLAAYPIGVTNELKDSLIYCGMKRTSHQVLVQRANKGDTLLNDVTELIGKEVYVKKDTKYYQRLQNLNSELGGGILIRDVLGDTLTTEDLIAMVSDRSKVRYTVSDEYLAKLNKTYYRNIDISLAVSFDQRSSWAVNKKSPHLAQKLDKWFAEKNNAPIYKAITKKYFELSKELIQGDYVAPANLPKGAISVYDDLFKKHSHGTNYDWHLLAAISYQESRFQNNLTSWAGASGIMGLMPRTAASLGLSKDDRMNPDLSIGAAVSLLNRLDKIFKNIDDKHERMKFILAAYNGGNGHINDAQALALKYGADPYVWDENVKKYLELKNNPEYYEDPVCKSGYFRSGETINYVTNVLATAERFKNKRM